MIDAFVADFVDKARFADCGHGVSPVGALLGWRGPSILREMGPRRGVNIDLSQGA
jgi:hypothetical protein